jgi:hypothetical protein
MAMIVASNKKNNKSSRAVTAREVKEIIYSQIEEKFQYYHPVAGTALAGAIQYDPLNIAQGDADNNRDGDQLRADNLTFRMSHIFNPSGNAVQNTRIVVYRWKPMSTSTQPTYIDVFTASTTYPITTPPNWDNRFQWKILFDRVITSSLYQPAPVLVHTVNLGKKRVQYTSGSSTVKSNGVYFLIMTDSATNGPIADVYYMTRYFDA